MRVSRQSIPGRGKSQYIVPCAGGLDLVTKTKFAEPGTFSRAQNIEIDINQGYQTPTGYERFDGQSKPSDAVFARLSCTITGSVSMGDLITGATSGATATVIDVITNESPSYLLITKFTGTFVAAEDLTVSAVVQAQALDEQAVNSASNPKQRAKYFSKAANEYRPDINAVPGSGEVLGVIKFKGVVYAFRNVVDGTAAELYKASSSGWVKVALGNELPFTSGGTIQIQEGQTITGATSGATAVVTRVMLESGSWAAGTAAGKFIYASQTGTFLAENIDVGGDTDLATITGDGDAITLQPNGKYKLEIENFGGQVSASRVYGVDGENRGFEFDGTVFCPIDTGMDVDTPTSIFVHRNHLFFSFDSSAQHSGISTPYAFTVIFGAAEIVVGDTITELKGLPGAEGNGTLGIFSRNRIHILYGTSNANWNLVRFREEVGAYPNTVQEFGMTLMLDDRGVDNLLTTQAYGNFQANTLSSDIQPFINERKSRATASTVVRKKSQYRLFFSDKNALYITTKNNKILGMMPMLLKHKVTCITSAEDGDGNEEIFFGSDDGFVYQMERGTSFDGQSIDYYGDFHYVHVGSPNQKKRWRSVVWEVDGSGYHEFTFSYQLGYGTAGVARARSSSVIADFQETRWDSGLRWDNFFFDGQLISPSRVKLSGSEENIQLKIRGSSDYFAPLSYSSAQLRNSLSRDKH